MRLLLAIILPLLAAAAEPPEQEPARPTPLNPREWVLADDYPLEAIRAGAEGRVRFTLEVDAEGRPLSCTVVESSGHAALDRTTCAVMLERARFAPARDSAGRAVPGTYSTHFAWRLQGETGTGLPFASWEVITALLRGSDGELSCTVLSDGRRGAVPQSGECGFLAGTGAAELLRSLGSEAQMTLVMRLHAQGRPPPVRSSGNWGELLVDVVADFVLDSDGRFAECGMTVNRMDPPPGLQAFPIPCGLHGRDGRPGFEPARRGERRSGRITVSLYLRRGIAL